MIVEEKRQDKIQDLLSACIEQHEKISRIIVETTPDFEKSKLRALVRSDKWPVAVHPGLLIDNENEDDKFGRAESILEQTISTNLAGRKFLDFGCGEGHVAKKASEQQVEMSIGYDIDETGWHRFHSNDRFLLTNDFQEVRRYGPYDAILLWDVLDHIMEPEDPHEVLESLNGILSDSGRVYVRCHPWCSKHGTHAYKDLNKAYVHYFFSEEELASMGVRTLPTRKIIHPITTYDDWFRKSGFKKIEAEAHVVRDSVEPLFQTEDILCSVIKGHWKDSYEERLSSGRTFPSHQLEICFLDFILVKA